MRCNEDLKAAGQSYPRTCAKCGLGKCQNLHRTEHGQLKAIGGLIRKLSYRDMQLLSVALSERLTSKTPQDVAESLLLICDRIENGAWPKEEAPPIGETPARFRR